MKSLSKTLALYIILFCFSVVGIPYLIVQKRIKEHSVQRDAEILRRWYETMFKVYMKGARLADGQALLITHGRAQFQGSNPDKFVISQGQTFEYGFDSATTVSFRVEKIDENGLLLEYNFSRVTHRTQGDAVVNYSGPTYFKWTNDV